MLFTGAILLAASAINTNAAGNPPGQSLSVKLNDTALECSADSVYGQSPAPVTSSPGWSDEADSVRAYDNFTGVSASITGIVWWGGGYNGIPCARTSETYEVAFYADNGNQPGALIASETVSPDYSDTASDVGFGTLRRYEAVFTTPVTLSSGWVSVYGTGQNNCYFYWANGNDGDANAYISSTGSVSADFSYCLISASTEETTGCCAAGKSDTLKASLKKMFGDYLIVGLSFMALSLLTIYTNRH